jgi:hypothetical protein
MSNKKLQLKFTSPDGKIKNMSLEEAKNFLFQGQHPMVVEGKMVRTYKELLDFVAREENLNKKIIEIKYLFISGG